MDEPKLAVVGVRAQGQLLLLIDPTGRFQLPWLHCGPDEAADLPAQFCIWRLFGWRVVVDSIAPNIQIAGGRVDLVLTSFDSDRPVAGLVTEKYVVRTFASGLDRMPLDRGWRDIALRCFEDV